MKIEIKVMCIGCSVFITDSRLRRRLNSSTSKNISEVSTAFAQNLLAHHKQDSIVCIICFLIAFHRVLETWHNSPDSFL